ncbi:MAG: thiamine phosphate synthase [Mariprofundaceae bacterium]|nr:thiamine phosphate synthase [Mariprofundaceae bacterium]
MSVPGLILITDSSRMPHEQFFEAVEASLCGGVDAVLVREKQMDSAHLLVFCSRLRAMTMAHNALLIVHSQADVARAVGADGVHVAAANMEEIPAMRKWLNHKEMTISASCHSTEELEQAMHYGVNFTLLSPVFSTLSHPQALPLGVPRFMRLAKGANLPVIALGGVTPDNRRELASFGVAVISAILDADTPKLAARRLSGM